MNELPAHDIVINGYTKFIIITNPDVKSRMEFEVHEVLSWECDDDNTPSDTELYLSGVIKWDGDSELVFGGGTPGVKNGYINLGDKADWTAHITLMEELYEYAASTIENYDRYVAE